VKRGPRSLSDEDRILWHRVARTVKPRPGMAVPAEPEAPTIPAAPATARGIAASPLRVEEPFRPFLPPYIPPVSSPAARPHLDRPTLGKIAKGQLAIDARIDLHGMTQADAHGTLLGFLHRANAAGHRHLLVITGKGRSKGGDGVLRRAVPGWFGTAAFRGLVSAWATAAHHHGGEGALYVRLRRGAPV
jgi:DNA-nicking Smr family endonuclease